MLWEAWGKLLTFFIHLCTGLCVWFCGQFELACCFLFQGSCGLLNHTAATCQVKLCKIVLYCMSELN